MIICNTTLFCSLCHYIVSSPQVKHHIRSDNFIQWCCLWKLSDYLYEMVAGKSIVVNKRKKERDRDRESRLKEWETQHRRGSEMAWVGSDTPENMEINGMSKRQSNSDINTFWVILKSLDCAMTFVLLSRHYTTIVFVIKIIKIWIKMFQIRICDTKNFRFSEWFCSFRNCFVIKIFKAIINCILDFFYDNSKLISTCNKLDCLSLLFTIILALYRQAWLELTQIAVGS